MKDKNDYQLAFEARKKEDLIAPALEKAKKQMEPGDTRRPFIHDDAAQKAFERVSIPAADQPRKETE